MVSGPVTAYSRAGRNRRNSRLLAAAFVLLMCLPAAFLVWYAGNILFLFVVLLLGRQVLESPDPFLIFLAALMAGMVGAIWIRALRVRSSLAERTGAVPTSRQPVLRRLENLAIAAGIPTPALYVLESRQPNAFATGLPTDGATVVITDGLLEAIGERDRELDGVLAHELAHICNEDTRLDSVLAAIIRTVRFPTPLYWIFTVGYLSALASILMTPLGLIDAVEMWREMLAAPDANDGSLPPRGVYVVLFWVNVLGPIPFILWPAIARFVQSHVARQREFLADAEAATLTRDPIGLARALATISAERYEALSSWPEALRIPFIRPRGSEIARQIGIEHLCIVLNHRGLFDAFFPTHPNPRDRIAALESMAPPECEVTAEAVAAPTAAPAAAQEATKEARAHEAARKTGLPVEPFLRGLAVGGLLQAYPFLMLALELVGSPSDVDRYGFLPPLLPFGLGGMIAAFVANRRNGGRLWWPVVLMLLVGNYLPALLNSGGWIPNSIGGFVLAYVVSLSEPAAGAALGAMARSDLLILLNRFLNGRGRKSQPP